MGMMEDMERRLAERIEAGLGRIEEMAARLAGSASYGTPAAAPGWMTPAECAAHVGVSRNTLGTWRARGEGPPHVKVGQVVRYERAAVDQWMRKNGRAR